MGCTKRSWRTRAPRLVLPHAPSLQHPVQHNLNRVFRSQTLLHATQSAMNRAKITRPAHHHNKNPPTRMQRADVGIPAMQVLGRRGGGAGNRTRVRAGSFRSSTCVAVLSLSRPPRFVRHFAVAAQSLFGFPPAPVTGAIGESPNDVRPQFRDALG